MLATSMSPWRFCISDYESGIITIIYNKCELWKLFEHFPPFPARIWGILVKSEIHHLWPVLYNLSSTSGFLGVIGLV